MSRCDTPKSEKVGGVPNQPKTPMQTFRLPEDRRLELRRAAEREGITVTELLRRLVDEYLDGP